MLIGQAARTTGTTARALRLYEAEGLIVPGRASNGYRDYCTPTLDRIIEIRRLLESGLPMRLVRAAVSGGNAEGGQSDEFVAEVNAYRGRLVLRLQALERRLTSVDQFLHELT